VVRQMIRQNRDVIGSGCVKDVEGKVVVVEETPGKKKKYWKPGKHIMTSCQMKSLFGTSTVCRMWVKDLVKRYQ